MEFLDETPLFLYQTEMLVVLYNKLGSLYNIGKWL